MTPEEIRQDVIRRWAGKFWDSTVGDDVAFNSRDLAMEVEELVEQAVADERRRCRKHVERARGFYHERGGRTRSVTGIFDEAVGRIRSGEAVPW